MIALLKAVSYGYGSIIITTPSGLSEEEYVFVDNVPVAEEEPPVVEDIIEQEEVVTSSVPETKPEESVVSQPEASVSSQPEKAESSVSEKAVESKAESQKNVNKF